MAPTGLAGYPPPTGETGIIANAEELATFVTAVLRDARLLHPALLKQMLEGGTPTFGLGVDIVDTPWGLAVGRAAAGFGYSAEAFYLPSWNRMVS